MIEQALRDQMSRGEDMNVRPITWQGRTEYRTMTAERKGRTSPIDLKDTGDFHRGIDSLVGRDNINFGSSDAKAGLIEQNTGPDIFGLNEKSLVPVIAEAGEIFMQKVKTKLQLWANKRQQLNG